MHPLRRVHQGKDSTRGEPIRTFAPELLRIPMAMHRGDPAAPRVEAGERVKLGQVIGAAVGPLGLPVHASASGTVRFVGPYVEIENDFRDDWAALFPLGDAETCPPEAVAAAVRDAGVCGMGGAAFPTFAKLDARGKRCDAVLINGAECETHRTCDHRLMVERADRVADGLRIAMRALGAARGVVAIEDDKPDAVEAMRGAAAGRAGVEVVALQTKYPQGSEKQLIFTVTGREVPSGGLPLDAGAVVLNAATACAIADAVIEGKPLIERVVTVAGCVRHPSNLLARVGTRVSDLIAACGGFSVPESEVGRILLGGAMTGAAVADADAPIGKADGAVVVEDLRACRTSAETPCIRCGRCAAVCPMRLEPWRLLPLCRAGDADRAVRAGLMDCIRCGCCSYVCPARLRLTPAFGDMQLRAARRGRRSS